MINKIISSIKSTIKASRPSGSIRPFKLKLEHMALLSILGLLLVIPSAITLINTAVPLSWERAEGVVSMASPNEVDGGANKYIVTVIYRLSGETFNTRIEHTGERLSRDDQVVIYYNPASPSEAVIQRGGPLSFLAWIPFLVGIAVMSVTAYKSYLSLRREGRYKILVSEGDSISALVKQAEVQEEKNFIQKLLYKNYIFFKLKAAPVTASSSNVDELFESNLYMWRGKMYGDVDRLKEDNTPVVIYQDKKNSDNYYFELSNTETENVADVESDLNVEEVPAETLPAFSAGSGFTSIQVPDFHQSESHNEVKQTTPLDIDLNTPSSAPAKDSSNSSLTDFDDGLATEDIDQLEKSLAGINATPIAIDLNFEDDPENINNKATAPTPQPLSIPTPLPVTPALSPNPQPVEPNPSTVISSISSEVESHKSVNTGEVSSTATQPLMSAPEINISPITNIGDSIVNNSGSTHAVDAVQVSDTYIPEQQPTPVQTPAPVLSRAELADAVKNDRRISVPRR